jgi:predicted nucleotidyltransferase
MQRKMALYNAQHVSATGIQKHTVQLLLNAEVNTTQPCVKRIQILQQNVHCVEETTWLITKVVTYTKTYKKEAEKQQINLDGTLLNHITETLTSTIITNFLF